MTKSQQLKYGMKHPLKSIKETAYYYVHKGELKLHLHKPSVKGVVVDLTIIICTPCLITQPLNSVSVVLYFLVALMFATMLVYGAIYIGVLIRFTIDDREFIKENRSKMFSLTQIKYGMRHPIKSYIESVKKDAYARTSSNKDVSSMPIGHMILVAPFFFLYFLHIATVVNWLTILVILFETLVFSTLLMESVGLLGMSFYNVVMEHIVKRKVKFPSIIICLVFTVLGWSGFILDFNFGLLTSAGCLVFPLVLLHMWHYKIVINEKWLIVKRYWWRDIYIYIQDINTIVIKQEICFNRGLHLVYQRVEFMDDEQKVMGFYRFNNIDHKAEYKDIKKQLNTRGNNKVRFKTEGIDYVNKL